MDKRFHCLSQTSYNSDPQPLVRVVRLQPLTTFMQLHNTDLANSATLKPDLIICKRCYCVIIFI